MKWHETTDVRVGPVTGLWQPHLNHFRHIHFEGIEILSGVYFALRDANWDTLGPEITDIRVQESINRWTTTLSLLWNKGVINFAGELTIDIESPRRLTFSFSGKSDSEFLANRIGFLVLHGGDCAGTPIEIKETSGRTVNGFFPQAISPHQPFLDIREIRHCPADGLTVTVRMDGEVFEMEDQRNWTDASFKTYSIPLFCGTDAFFAEINRERPAVNVADGIAFSLNPQVHAGDKLSMIESLAIQGVCVQNALSFGAASVSVSPVTFKMRRNPNATTADGYEVPEALQVDRRQWTSWGAAWVLGSVKYLAEAGANSATYFKTGGPVGIMGKSPTAEQQPLYDLFLQLGKWKGSIVTPSHSTHPPGAYALFLSKRKQSVILAANPTAGDQEVEFSWNEFQRRETIAPESWAIIPVE